MKMEHTELHGTVIKEIYSILKRNDLKSIQPQSQGRYEKQKHRASIGRVRRAKIKNKHTNFKTGKRWQLSIGFMEKLIDITDKLLEKLIHTNG